VVNAYLLLAGVISSGKEIGSRPRAQQALGDRSITSTTQYVGTSDGQAAEEAQAALMRLY
jgi:hypothetical protein